MRRLILCLIVLAGLTFVTAAAPKVEMNLWAPGKVPQAKGDAKEDLPAVQMFRPTDYGAKPTGASIVVCPGGGYGMRADHEGPVVGEWLAQNGVTAFVLRYRLGSKGYHHPVPSLDAAR